LTIASTPRRLICGVTVGGCGETSTKGSFTGITGATAPTNYGNQVTTTITSDVIGGVNASIAFRQLNAASEEPRELRHHDNPEGRRGPGL
jgi:hypothetical protein